MRDFTIKSYVLLLNTFKAQGYAFQTFAEFMTAPAHKVIILRHDVDKLPGHSLVMAKTEHELGIHGSYYFRSVSESWDEKIISEIASLGHEIGYHYENMSTFHGGHEMAFTDFKMVLARLRQLAPVKTICMHGSPTSKWDSRDLWEKFDYHTLGIIGEPYFDIDFNQVFYLTDTGRRWDGYKVSVRDKIPQHQQRWETEGWVFRSTRHILNSFQSAKSNNPLPGQIMLTLHPQRWNSSFVPWLKELIMQKSKNIIKRLIVKKNANCKLP